ncbi:hypothetical protein H312_01357 [Anncaliia algerae PRA339]|uniref:ISXO2-like transposase domain-containing protein n=1 Tax=Anncaliia algerae PRA339 TaxID=1288291 RepID=A0A059F2M8_9MICR|nr:hypothetical protein H312_01357 [Anncaliia algerae PRA339]
MIPIITSLVIPGSVLYTDEHKIYKVLSELGYIHKSFATKKNSLIKKWRANTQAVECFNNYLKYYIKKKKGVEPQRREDFLLGFTWKFNFKYNLFETLLNLIKFN